MLQNMTLGSRVRVAHPEPSPEKPGPCSADPALSGLTSLELGHAWINILLHVQYYFQGWISEHGCVQQS